MKLVYTLIAVSLGVIAFGLYVIMQEQSAQQPDVTEPPGPVGVLPAPVPRENRPEPAMPEAALAEGSEAWCDMMMDKANDEWTEHETQTFADNCIYENQP